MPLNSIDEIYAFSGLDSDTVQPSEIQTALSFASDLVVWLSPDDDSDRSERAEPIRKRAEAYLATAELYRKLGPFLSLTTPGKQILTTLSITIGTDFPTPVDYQNAMMRAASNYESEGKRLLASIRPVTAVIEAGS